MTRQILLKDALGSWPPTGGTAAGDDSPTAELGDIITKARLSSDGHYLFLHLKKDVQEFITSSPVVEKYKGLLARELQNMISKTVGEAGSIPLGVA